MPKLIPVKAGTYEPVFVKMDDGSVLCDDGKPAEFSRREALWTSCHRRPLKEWLAGKGRTRKKVKLPGESKATGGGA